MRRLIVAALLLAQACAAFAQGTSSASPTSASGTSVVLIRQSGTTLPATCTIGQIFFKTNATAGQNVYGCTSANTWTSEGGSSTIPLNSISAAAALNSINNGDFAQTWNWALTTAGKSAFTFTENTASTNGVASQFLVDIGTIASSTANPLRVRTQASTNNILVDKNGAVTITAGPRSLSGTPQAVNITGGTCDSGGGETCGAVNLVGGGNLGTTSTPGSVTLTGGLSTTNNAVGGQVIINTGDVNATNGTTGTLTMRSADSGFGTNHGTGPVFLLSGAPRGSGNSGTLTLGTGAPVGTSTASGAVTLGSGACTGQACTSGALTISTGDSTNGSAGSGAIGTITIQAGTPHGSTTAVGGTVSILAGGGNGIANGGPITIQTGGASNASAVNGGLLTLQTGNSATAGNGGNIAILSGDGGTSSGQGGNITITTGAASGSGVGGDVIFQLKGAVDVARFKSQHLIRKGSSPTITANCGASPSIVGKDEAMLVTVGTGGTATDCTMTFANAFTTNAPICNANSNTDLVALKVVTTTTTVAVDATAAFTAGSKLHIQCKGWE